MPNSDAYAADNASANALRTILTSTGVADVNWITLGVAFGLLG